MSRHDALVTIFGGSGFLGRHLVRALAKRGYRIKVAVRRPDLAGHLQPLGRVGQIHAVQANVRYPESVMAAARGADVVINLVGILFERSRQRFAPVHTAGAGAVAQAAAETGARMLHVSAIGADAHSRAAYARSKRAGEEAVLAATPSATIFRPSVMFGPEDDFLNRFAAMATLSPALPLVGAGETRFQPVYVADVAAAIAAAADGRARPGLIYELGGPEAMNLKQILQFTLATIERRRLLIPTPFALAKAIGYVAQYLPNPPLTPDQVELLKYDNVVSETAKRERRTLEDLDIAPTAMEAIAPSYLWRFRKTGQFRSSMA